MVKKLALTMVAAILSAQGAWAEGIFSPMALDRAADNARAVDTTFRTLADSPATAHLALVEVNAAAVNEGAAQLELNLEGGLRLRAHQTQFQTSKTGTQIWMGVIEDEGSNLGPVTADTVQFDPLNRVALARNGNMVTGNIHFAGEWYKLRPLRSGGHAIVRVDAAGMPPEHPAEYANLPHYKMAPAPTPLLVNTTIRVLVNYTPSVAAAVADINGMIDLAVAETNQGYQQSGVMIDMVLANKSQTTYSESSFSNDLSRYRGTTDKYMKEIHTTRNNTAADVALLVINNASSCGLASSIGSTAATAFAVAHWDCITGYYSFGHEIGHLQSARHDPDTDGSTTPYAYGHGYRYTGGSPSWRTIMSYACSVSCPRINYWSNPNTIYNGVPMGTAALNDNARVLNTTKDTVAAFR